MPRNDPFTSRVVMVLKALPLAEGVADELRALADPLLVQGDRLRERHLSHSRAARGRTDVEIPPTVARVSRASPSTRSTPPIDLTLR